jgi:hypothetical protein
MPNEGHPARNSYITPIRSSPYTKHSQTYITSVAKSVGGLKDTTSTWHHVTIVYVESIVGTVVRQMRIRGNSAFLRKKDLKTNHPFEWRTKYESPTYYLILERKSTKYSLILGSILTSQLTTAFKPNRRIWESLTALASIWNNTFAFNMVKFFLSNGAKFLAKKVSCIICFLHKKNLDPSSIVTLSIIAKCEWISSRMVL